MRPIETGDVLFYDLDVVQRQDPDGSAEQADAPARAVQKNKAAMGECQCEGHSGKSGAGTHVQHGGAGRTRPHSPEEQ